jgi:hypothetical protein
VLEINLPLLSRNLFCHDSGFVVVVVVVVAAASVIVSVGVVIAVAPTVVLSAAGSESALLICKSRPGLIIMIIRIIRTIMMMLDSCFLFSSVFL